MKKGVEITAQRASEFGITPQGKDESEMAFKNRVSGILRSKGHIIEAHEAYNNALYDDESDDSPMTGILGAVAQAMSDKGEFSPGKGERQIGDDIAAGHVTRAPKNRSGDAAMLMLFMGLFGGSDRD